MDVLDAEGVVIRGEGKDVNLRMSSLEGVTADGVAVNGVDIASVFLEGAYGV